MTAISVSARPLPWRRMAWVTWRQHRLTAAGVGVLLGTAALYLLVTGLRMHQAYAAVAACRPVGSDGCRQVAQGFSGAYAHVAVVTAGLLQTVPALIGAFAGAPVLAREFETGTFRYAWTQGFGRSRWTVAKLAPLALAVTAAAAAFSALFSWYYQPIISAGGDSDTNSLAATIFDLRGVALAGWTLAAFAIGALAGVLVRRVIPAMFATLATWAGLAFVTGAFLRPHYEAPLVSTSPVAASDWVMSESWTHDGRPATVSMLDGALRPVGVHALSFDVFEPGPGTSDTFDPVQYLAQHGFTHATTYQPADRFWPFQWIEGGWLLALSVALIGATVWLVRRRAT